MLTTPRVMLVAVLAGAVISLTAIDKYDEANCRTARSAEPTLRNYAGPRQNMSLRRRHGIAPPCGGSLPW